MCYILNICVCKYIIFGSNKALFYCGKSFCTVFIFEGYRVCCFISCKDRIPCAFYFGNLLTYKVASVFACCRSRILCPSGKYVICLCGVCGNVTVCKYIIGIVLLNFLVCFTCVCGLKDYAVGILILNYGIKCYACGSKYVFYNICCNLSVCVINICTAGNCCPTHKFLGCIYCNRGNFRISNCFAFCLCYNFITCVCYECDCIFIEVFFEYRVPCAFNSGNLLAYKVASVFARCRSGILGPTLEGVVCLCGICGNVTVCKNIVGIVLCNFYITCGMLEYNNYSILINDNGIKCYFCFITENILYRTCNKVCVCIFGNKTSGCC